MYFLKTKKATPNDITTLLGVNDIGVAILYNSFRQVENISKLQLPLFNSTNVVTLSI